MEYCFRLTVWECLICGIRRASGRLLHIPSEIIGIYQRCGRSSRTIRIEDGSIFVMEEMETREYLCRNIREFQKKGRVYWIVMTGRAGKVVQLYLPVRIVGDEQAQKDFQEYLNDQRRISGDKLVLHGGVVRSFSAETDDLAEKLRDGGRGEVQHIRQKWNLDKLSGAAAECLWIQRHCLMGKWWKDWAVRRSPFLLLCVVVYLGLWQILKMQTIPICLALLAMLGFWTSQELEQLEKISMKDIRSQVERLGSEIYNEEWKLTLCSQGIRRKAPCLENVWGWETVGNLIETEDFYFFFDRQQNLMFYCERILFGDWMSQKLFVQRCQERGIRFESVQPKIIKDRDCSESMPAGDETGKILPIADIAKGREKHQEREKRQEREKSREKKKHRWGRESATQEGWRDFWARKEKEQYKSDKKQGIMVVLGIAVLLILAFVLPEYGGRSELAGMPVMMDMPSGGEPYVFHPESYKDYAPLAKQVEVLQSLGFEIPEEALAALNEQMEEMPMSRVWVEGYPYRSLLMILGMPKRNNDTWEMESYSNQAYWFDWEGFDMSREYVYILNGVNAMANGEFTITDATQEMSAADWEKGSGVVHVSFCVNGIPYETELKLEYDWLDSKIIGDINKGLEKAGIEKRVYATGDGGQGCILLYGDKAWAKQFRKATGITLEKE